MLKKCCIFVTLIDTPLQMMPVNSDLSYASTLLSQICNLIPNGLEKAILFYNMGENNSLVAAYTDRTMISQTVMLPANKCTSYIRKQRERGLRWEWFALHELDFEKDSYRPAESTLFTPLYESVLLLRLPTKTDNISDLLFLFFNKHISYLQKPVKEEEFLLKQTKDAIGSILFGVFSSLCNYRSEQHDILKALTNMMKGALSEAEGIKHQLSQLKIRHQERIFRYCVSRLKAISNEKARTIFFHDKAKQKLLLYDGDIENLDAVIKNAVFFTEYLAEDDHSPIVINDFHIQYTFTKEENTAGRSIPNQRSSEAREYLDKLESAAIEIQSSLPNTKLTGAVLGSHMRPKVSASAISQWISKYGSEMRELLVTHESSWRAIRENFQPIKRNLLDSYSEILKDTGT